MGWVGYSPCLLLLLLAQHTLLSLTSGTRTHTTGCEKDMWNPKSEYCNIVQGRSSFCRGEGFSLEYPSAAADPTARMSGNWEGRRWWAFEQSLKFDHTSTHSISHPSHPPKLLLRCSSRSRILTQHLPYDRAYPTSPDVLVNTTIVFRKAMAAILARRAEGARDAQQLALTAGVLQVNFLKRTKRQDNKADMHVTAIL